MAENVNKRLLTLRHFCPACKQIWEEDIRGYTNSMESLNQYQFIKLCSDHMKRTHSRNAIIHQMKILQLEKRNLEKIRLSINSRICTIDQALNELSKNI